MSKRNIGGKREPVGQIGLGIMGGAFAKHLLAAGFDVIGYDPDPKRAAQFARRGGRNVSSAAAVAARTRTIITSLPSIKACEAVYLGRDGLATRARRGTIVVEASTMPLETKEALRDGCARGGITVLDCPISGTGAQAAAKDISVYASGERAAVERLTDVFAGFARSMHYCGPFGNGTRLKFVANLLVTIHNLAAAEAIVLGLKSGVDLDLLFKVIRDGAGNSRMFEVRGPLMVANDYSDAHMKCEIYQKDIDIIGAFAAKLRCPTPLFEASKPYYSAALAQGHARDDTAAICAVLERMAGITRNQPRKRKGKGGK
jgi:3-hydroxyisobutyrate dehydrogenase-like beta-hydroxyacid dehydrogenase